MCKSKLLIIFPKNSQTRHTRRNCEKEFHAADKDNTAFAKNTRTLDIHLTNFTVFDGNNFSKTTYITH